MKIAVTGIHGQIAQALNQQGKVAGCRVSLVGRPKLDLVTATDRAVLDSLAATEPDVIVNAAAYTAVDLAETNPSTAYAVNERGAGSVAKASAALGIPLIHLSTDYVYDGNKQTPYVESDQTDPQGVYGASKLAGEKAVLREQPDSVVLRTAWIISPFGSNFVRTMLRLAEAKDEIRVVADQRGNPTDAVTLADAILAISRNLVTDKTHKLRGLFHIAGTGAATWAELARKALTYSAEYGGPTAAVIDIKTADYPTVAVRPENSALDCSRIAALHNVTLPDWQSPLSTTVRQILDIKSSKV